MRRPIMHRVSNRVDTRMAQEDVLVRYPSLPLIEVQTRSEGNLEGVRGRFENGQFRASPPVEKRCTQCRRSAPEVRFYARECSACVECSSEKQRQRRNFKRSRGTIYFVQIQNTDGFVKIGYTGSTEKRFPNNFFTDCPYPLSVLSLTSGFVSEEKELHRRLKEGSGLRGEWYYPTTDVMTFASMAKVDGDLFRVLKHLRWRAS